MEKKSIFGKIDAFYTKSVKVIIGDIPLDDEKKTAGAKSKRPAVPKNKIEVIKQTFTTVKSKFLNLGKPTEKELLYKEVVKKEKQEAKTAKQTSKKKKTTTKKSPTAKKTTKASSTTAKAAAKKPVAKKPVAKTTTTKKANPTSKTTTTKKTVAKKTTATTKTTVKKPASKTTKTTDKKKAPVKKATGTTTKAKATTSKKPVAKKVSTSKTESTKAKSTVKPKVTISKRDAKIALYAKDITKHYGQVDNDFLTIIVKNLGPSIYKRDAELVSCSDPKELDTVRKNFLMKKLNIEASKGVLDAAIQDVCTELKGVRTKYRATFYYALAKKFKKESALS